MEEEAARRERLIADMISLQLSIIYCQLKNNVGEEEGLEKREGKGKQEDQRKQNGWNRLYGCRDQAHGVIAGGDPGLLLSVRRPRLGPRERGEDEQPAQQHSRWTSYAVIVPRLEKRWRNGDAESINCGQQWSIQLTEPWLFLLFGGGDVIRPRDS